MIRTMGQKTNDPTVNFHLGTHGFNCPSQWNTPQILVL
ncbi:hypothetical protein NOC27_1558 [Nitrosococcus oceani AFC27]|nr:hypothetical protein NOC27_1558 [Nitrosococcus oceani AFC27]